MRGGCKGEAGHQGQIAAASFASLADRQHQSDRGAGHGKAITDALIQMFDDGRFEPAHNRAAVGIVPGTLDRGECFAHAAQARRSGRNQG
jgi:hypothetical protein